MDSITNMGADAWALISAYALQGLGVLFALLVGWTVAGWTRRSMERAFERTKFDLTLGRFFSNLARYAILTGTVLGCLGAFGVETTSFAAVIGAAGLAIGLAFQGSLSNFSSGVMLLVFRPFKVGDVVNVAGVLGTVVQIELFTTEIKTPDNRKMVVPNTTIFSGNIENITALPTRRVDVNVGVDYAADIDETRKILEDVIAKTDKRIDDPVSVVFLKGLGGSSVDWVLRVWCKTEDYWAVHEAVTRASKMALDGAGIGIPFPQMDVHFDTKGLRTVIDKAA